MAKVKKQGLSADKLLEQVLVPEDEQPYEVPANWVWTRLKNISDIVTGSTPSKSNPDFYDGQFPFIKPSDLEQGRNVNFASEYLSEQGKSVSRVIPAGATSVCCIGSIGKCGYLEVEATTNQQINSVIPKINELYVYYYCCTDAFVNELLSMASATTISIVNKGKMSDVRIPLAPILEQQRIVNRIESLFSKLDLAKDLAQNALGSFESRKEAILHKAFTGELTEKWREAHGVSIDSWEDVSLKEVCTINPKRADVRGLPDDLDVTFVPMSSVSDVTGAITSSIVKPLGEVRKGYTNFMPNDVIFAKITPCMENSKSAIVGDLVNGIGFGSTEFHVFRCSEKLNNHYLHHLVRSQSFRDEAKAVMTGAVGQQRVPREFLDNYSIRMPSSAEQVEIVRILEQLFENDQQANDLIDVVDKIDLIKKAILARAFRGELGTNDPSERSALDLLKEVCANQ